MRGTPFLPLDPLYLPFSESTAAELPRCFRILGDYAGCGVSNVYLARQFLWILAKHSLAIRAIWGR
jgi:hypothetical protein